MPSAQRKPLLLESLKSIMVELYFWSSRKLKEAHNRQQLQERKEEQL
jgi:hypothetical protein